MPRFTEVTLPAVWASYLVNGDASGIDEQDVEQADAWQERNGLRVVSTVDDAEPRFTWSYELYGGNTRGGDVLDYIAHYINDGEGK